MDNFASFVSYMKIKYISLSLLKISASFTMDTGSFPGVKRPVRGADHPLSPSAVVKKE
jgi:hypothetical protein